MKLINYGEILIYNTDECYNDALNELKQNGNVVIDFDKIKSMTTLFASQVFGRLYEHIGRTDYFEKVSIINLTDDLKIMMRLGMERYMENMMY